MLDLKFLDRILSDRAEVTVDRLGVETILHEPHVRAVIAFADSRARHAPPIVINAARAGYRGETADLTSQAAIYSRRQLFVKAAIPPLASRRVAVPWRAILVVPEGWPRNRTQISILDQMRVLLE